MLMSKYMITENYIMYRITRIHFKVIFLLLERVFQIDQPHSKTKLVTVTQYKPFAFSDTFD